MRGRSGAAGAAGERRRGSADAELTVLYDGGCRLCQGAVDRLQALKPSEPIRYAAVQELTEDELQQLFRGAPPASGQLLEKIHAVARDGAVYAGSAAVVRALRSVRGFGRIAWLYRLPGMRPLADALYRYVAARRYAWFGRVSTGCGADCAMPSERGSDGDGDGHEAECDHRKETQ